MNQPTVGILSIGTYLPTARMTASEISKESGLSEKIIADRLGILEKPIPNEDDHSCAMGAQAAKIALKKAQVNPLEVDVILSVGGEYKEYPFIVSGIKIQQLIGAKNAWALDVNQRTCSVIAGLKMAVALMRSDETIKTLLLAGGYRNSDLIDYKNPRLSFMFNLGAGGGALLLRRGHDQNLLLGSSLISDGDFADDVYIEAGGSKRPVSWEDFGTTALKLDVHHEEEMRARLEERYHHQFIKAIHEALERSGPSHEKIDYLALLHLQRSAHLSTLKALDLRLDQSYYLERYGHIGQFDPIFSLEKGERAGRIKSGALVMMASAGFGHTWGAQAIRWG